MIDYWNSCVGDGGFEVGKTTHQLGPVRDTLVRKGMVYSPAHGDIAFTVPLFDQFMKRTLKLPMKEKKDAAD
jgi:hypothetical protein